jgi:hypothetical protein
MKWCDKIQLQTDPIMTDIILQAEANDKLIRVQKNCYNSSSYSASPEHQVFQREDEMWNECPVLAQTRLVM